MAEITFVTVTWTAGDVITEAKLDNMTANDQAVDAHALGIQFSERAAPSTPAANTIHLYAADSSSITKLKLIDPDGNVQFIDTVAEVTLSDSATIAIDWSDGPSQRVTATAARTFTFANPIAGGRYLLAVKNSGGAWTHTWPASVLWSSGATPAGSADTQVDLYGWYYHGGESKYLGFTSLDYNV